MAVQHFDIIRKPFSFREGIVVTSSVTDQQLYDGAVHTPDYTLAPLVLSPYVNVSDQEGDVSGDALSRLTNLKWTLVEVGGRKRDIPSSGDADFSWVGAGDKNAGRLKVMRNALPEGAMTLVFEADHVDMRTKDVHHVMLSHVVRCRNAAVAPPTLLLSIAAQSFFNPLRDAAVVDVKGTLVLSGRELLPGEVDTQWEVQVAGARAEDAPRFVSWDDASVKSGLVSVLGDGTLRLDRSKVKKVVTVRCRSRKRGAEVWIEEIFSVVRRIPFLKDPYFTSVPMNVSRQQEYINPVAIVEDVSGIVPNPDRVLAFDWWKQRGTADGSGAWQLHYDHSSRPMISTSFIDPVYGGNLRLEWRDREAELL